MWSTEASSTSTATPAAIWPLYANVDGWSAWDESLVSSQLHGAFIVGSTGEMQIYNAPTPLAFTLTEVTPQRSFSDDTPFPGATITFEHTLKATPEGTRITHRATIHGEAWERYAGMFGANLEHGVKEAVQSLARLAER
jgi:hypothetical protein